jgi:aminoglycoside 6'-N-acetyltransferase I
MLRMSFMIRRATDDDKPEWLRMRHGLWPEAPLEYLALDLDDLLADDDTAVFMAFNENGQPVGFIEVSLRSFAEGCETSPVGYIEAWFVGELVRRQNLGRDLAYTAEQWAREKGCSEMASDTWLGNEESITAHLRLGYHEADRLVHFVKRL